MQFNICLFNHTDMCLWMNTMFSKQLFEISLATISAIPQAYLSSNAV